MTHLARGRVLNGLFGPILASFLPSRALLRRWRPGGRCTTKAQKIAARRLHKAIVPEHIAVRIPVRQQRELPAPTFRPTLNCRDQLGARLASASAFI